MSRDVEIKQDGTQVEDAARYIDFVGLTVEAAPDNGVTVSGGRGTWVALFDTDDLANLDDCTTDGGTWVLAGGVISQTDDTDDDDTEKTLTFDLSAAMTADTVAGLTGIAIAVECRADMAPGTGNFTVFGFQSPLVSLGLTKAGGGMVVYEDGGGTPVPQGTWSAQSYAMSAVATGTVADGVVMNDGGGTGGVPRANGLGYGTATPSVDVVAYVGGLNQNDFSGTPVALSTTNGKASFRRYRIFGLYGLPALP